MLNQLALKLGNFVNPQKAFGPDINCLSDYMDIDELKPLLSLSTSELEIHLGEEPLPIDWTVVDRESKALC